MIVDLWGEKLGELQEKEDILMVDLDLTQVDWEGTMLLLQTLCLPRWFLAAKTCHIGCRGDRISTSCLLRLCRKRSQARTSERVRITVGDLRFIDIIHWLLSKIYIRKTSNFLHQT